MCVSCTLHLTEFLGLRRCHYIWASDNNNINITIAINSNITAAAAAATATTTTTVWQPERQE